MKFSFNLKVPKSLEDNIPQDYEQQMLYQAISFFQAGSRCDADFRLTPNLTNSLSAPAAVCYALSIEIYFKLLLKLSGGKSSNIHGFVELFKNLAEEIRKEIISRSDMNETDFVAFIRPLSDTFVKWRYLYEADTAWTSIPNLAWLAQILHNVVRYSHPSLKVSYENKLVLPENFQY